MHVLESYSTYCGLKIDKPFILEKFAPLPVDKYISIQGISRVPSSSYDYWQEVVDLVFPYLSAQGIKILQIGNKEDKPFKNCLPANGQLDLNQLAYVVRRSMLHFGADSLPVHLASGYTKIVCLYPNTYVNQSKPYWSDDSEVSLIEPDRKGNRPFYFSEDPSKLVNSVAPEKIAKEILRLLNIPHEISNLSVNLGKKYNSEVSFDFVLDQTVTPNDTTNPISVRLDYLFDEQNLIKQLNICKCVIHTDKPIKREILKTFKSKIIHIYYVVGNEDQPDFVNEIRSLAIPCTLISFLPKEEVDAKKIHYYDKGSLCKIETPKQEEIDKFKGLKGLYFKTSKVIASKGKMYPSKFHWKNDVKLDVSKFNQVVDDPSFWEDLEYFYLIQKP